MANYIKSEVLSEAYTHLAIEIFEDKGKLEELRSELTNFFHDRASFLFGTDVEINIVFEEGSLRTRVIAVGSVALAIAEVVGAYGSFREGIVQLSNDAVTLAQSANMEVIFRTKTPYCDRLRIEKRKGVFGRVSALLSELDAVAMRVDSSRLPTSQAKLREATETVDALITWDQNTDRLFAKFEGAETEACIASGLLEEVKKLPRQFGWHRELTQATLRAQIAAAEPEFSGKVAAVGSHYAVSLKSIEKKLKDRLNQATDKLAN